MEAKRMLEARAERMRAPKQIHLQETHETSGQDNSAFHRKTLAVLLMESFSNRQKMKVTDAVKEAASITG